MRLNSQQHEVFATALHSLLTYVNQRCGIVRNDTGASRVDQCMQHELVARFLWDHCNLIDDYVQENPDNLAPAYLSCAAGLVGTLYGTLFMVRRNANEATVLHYTGAYTVSAPSDAYFTSFPDAPVEVRGAIAPCGDCIVAIPPLTVMGLASEAMLDQLRADLAAHGTDRPISDADVLTSRARSWRAHRTSERLRQERDGHQVKGPGAGYHRGKLAGLSEQERAKLVSEHLKHKEHFAEFDPDPFEPICLHTRECPEHLEDALALLDDEWLYSIALDIDEEGDVPELSHSKLVQHICKLVSTRGEHLRDSLLLLCDEEELGLVRLLAQKGEVSAASIDPAIMASLDALMPIVFIVETEHGTVAWMAPEMQRLVSEADFPTYAKLRRRLNEARYAARALATMCGVISMGDAYERYLAVARDPLDYRHFSLALAELEDRGSRDDYALWRHNGTSYLISAEISDSSAAARVSREMYADHIMSRMSSANTEGAPLMVTLAEDDEDEFLMLVTQKALELEQMRLALLNSQRDLPPHELPPFMLTPSPTGALAKLDALRALRTFVDAHIPNDQNDYEFADLFVRSIIVSSVLMGESYNETMDVIRLYHMEGCEGTDYSDTLGRLVTNAYNALPRWDLNGWSLEENTERITGKRRFFNADGTAMTLADSDPCPCGSGKAYGACCGNRRLAS